MSPALPIVVLQELPNLTGILSTLIVVAVVLVVGRVLLNIALKVVVVAAIILGAIWAFGALGGLSALPF